MTKDEYYSLKKGDIVRWQDTGSKCIVMHFDTSDYPRATSGEPRQSPNDDQSLCVIFIDDNLRLIGSRREFGYITQKKLNKTNNTNV
jgi:hypothetical protein